MEEAVLGETPLMQFLRNETYGFVATGKMATALIAALTAEGHQNVIASRRNKGKRKALERKYGIQTTSDNALVVEVANTVLLCSKPQDQGVIAQEIAAHVSVEKLLISIAAGKTVQDLEALYGADKRIVRTMPNLGSYFGHGYTGYTLNKNCSGEDRARVEYLFTKGGYTLEIPEAMMDALTYGSACRIGLLSKDLQADAYFLKRHGFSKEDIQQMQIQMLRTTAEYLEEGTGYHALYKKVASKKGATEAAHMFGRTNGMYDLLRERADAAVVRCQNLRKK